MCIQLVDSAVFAQQQDNSFSLVRERFYWPRMYPDIVKWIHDCGRCIEFKTPDNHEHPLLTSQQQNPWSWYAWIT